jgi:predicted amidohydrolase YtcJ
MTDQGNADLIITNARITTLDAASPEVSACAISGGRIAAIGTEGEIDSWRGAATQVVDARRRRVVPGLNDSHIHLIRGGLNFNLELRWDDVRSVADALARLKVQAQRTPPPQWVRVVGGWSEFQFAERRMPTLQEINDAAPETPVFVLHLYDRAWLNAAALRAVGYTKTTPDPPGARIERDRHGNPTGLLIASPNASILYSTLARGPRLSPDDQANSSRHFMRELNRLGVTSVIDAGGGFQNYPDDYQVVDRLHHEGHLTVRIAYNLFTQRPGHELEDFQRWSSLTAPYQGDPYYRMNGAGEMLAFSAADFEDFLEPRPELAAGMEASLEAVVRHLAEHQWPFRLHATYDESISRFLDVFERVHRDVPLDRLRWLFDHAETISPQNLERVRRLGGGIAVQHRMVYQGEHFVARYGAAAAKQTPPIRRMLAMDIPVGAGTDATRVASYNPWVALQWLVTGRTVGDLELYGDDNRLDRETALRLYTAGSAWFSREEDVKGRLTPGAYADLAMLSDDYFTVAAADIRGISSVLTVVGGRIVHGDGEFRALAPALPPVSPEWSPQAVLHEPASAIVRSACARSGHVHHTGVEQFWGLSGCGCWAF